MNEIYTEIQEELYRATKTSIEKLFCEYAEHDFYYLVLVTTPEALRPCISAWSSQLLCQTASSQEEYEDFKWSSADSPLYAYDDHNFSNLSFLFSKLPVLNENNWETETNRRLIIMESTLAKLDKRGAFGIGKKRESIFINVDVAPPDTSDTERAKRLNPTKAIAEWLIEAAE